MRSAERLWGLPDLNKVEIEQVALSNALLRTVVLFLAAARVYSLATIMGSEGHAGKAAAGDAAWSTAW